MSNLYRLSFDDWMRISKCVKLYAEDSIDEFKKENTPLFGSAGTVADKLFSLSNNLRETAQLLRKIDEAVTDMTEREEEK